MKQVNKLEATEYLLTRFDSLRWVNPSKFIEEALPVIDKIETAETWGDFRPPTGAACMLYRPLYEANRGQEAEKIHQRIQQALQKTKQFQDLVDNDNNSYAVEHFRYLFNNDFEAFYREVKVCFANLDHVTTLQEVDNDGQMAKMAYLTLCNSGRLDDAISMHESIQRAFKRLNAQPDAMKGDWRDFLIAVGRSSPGKSVGNRSTGCCHD